MKSACEFLMVSILFAVLLLLACSVFVGMTIGVCLIAEKSILLGIVSLLALLFLFEMLFRFAEKRI